LYHHTLLTDLTSNPLRPTLSGITSLLLGSTVRLSVIRLSPGQRHSSALALSPASRSRPPRPRQGFNECTGVPSHACPRSQIRQTAGTLVTPGSLLPGLSLLLTAGFAPVSSESRPQQTFVRSAH
jgi:hypothetical protein